MKALKCEMCGGTDVVKQDGFFVCQICGTKYSTEDAKRLMIEGTVRVDNSPLVEKYLANARRAKQKEDWEETEKYYNLVEQNEPTNIEAIFYSSYGKAKTALIDSDIYKRQAAFKVLQNCISIVDDNFNLEKEEEQKTIIKQISDDILLMSGSSYVYNQKKGSYGVVVWSDKRETEQLFINLNNEFCTTLNEIVKKYPEKDSRIPFYYELAILHKTVVADLEHLAYRPPLYEEIHALHLRWHWIDPTHEVPEKQTVEKSGCYVATCVYGSYDCPQVWTLRRYRDYTLAETWYGRAFIRTYYAISPTLVKWFGHTKWFKRMWKGKLDRMVTNLQSQGIESTPYVDRNWR